MLAPVDSSLLPPLPCPLPALPQDAPAALEAWPDAALWGLARAVAGELSARRLPVPVGLAAVEAAAAVLLSLPTPG